MESSGSIPACAGEPQPCACSKQAPARGSIPACAGEPRRPAWIRKMTTTGSIPACAGEPRHRHLSRHVLRVYPRVCGGADKPISVREAGWGLSPRVRGSPVPMRVVRPSVGPGLSPRVRGSRLESDSRLSARGSIPACAGEPPGRCRAPDDHRVYPRVCGGALEGSRPDRHETGLSPRVRGSPGILAYLLWT